MCSVLVEVIKNPYECQSCHNPSDTYGDTKLIKARKSTPPLPPSNKYQLKSIIIEY